MSLRDGKAQLKVALRRYLNTDIFKLKTDEVTGEWKRIDKEELYDFCFSSYIIHVIK
jgi:hypothetical protein